MLGVAGVDRELAHPLALGAGAGDEVDALQRAAGLGDRGGELAERLVARVELDADGDGELGADVGHGCRWIIGAGRGSAPGCAVAGRLPAVNPLIEKAARSREHALPEPCSALRAIHSAAGEGYRLAASCRRARARCAKAVAGRVVMVTGASSGIGEAAARLIGGAGATVLLVARGEEELKRIAAEIGRRRITSARAT